MANNYFYNSSSVKIYPSSKRSDAFDRNSRLFTEQNIISTVNRLTSRDSFIIDGLTIENAFIDNSAVEKDPNRFIIKSGSCNIHGYLFNLDDLELNISEVNAKAGDWLYLAILIKKTIVTANNTKTAYEELSPIALNTSNNGYNISLDAELTLIDTQNNPNDSSSSKFKGIVLKFGEEDHVLKHVINEDSAEGKTLVEYRLPIGVYNGESLISIANCDGGSAWNKAKFSVEDIYVKAESLNQSEPKLSGANYSEPQDLLSWLQSNYIIDDGEITN